MRHFEIVMILIEQGDVYHLQLRNIGAHKGAFNKIGCFGGSIEDGEQAVQAACRELAEETSLTPQPEDLQLLGEVNVVADREGQPVSVHSLVYRCLLAPDQSLVAHEGEVITIPRVEVRKHLDDFTPGTRACFEELIPQE